MNTIKDKRIELSQSSCQTDMAAAEAKLESELDSNSNNDTNNVELPTVEQIKETDNSGKESDKPKDSRLKDREERPLVLEERHSLSIAETKKRRASVYSNENLFIPKKLARGELHLRKYQYLDQISKNSDYCMRMLKFPVGSGRARYVAQQLKRKKSKKLKEVPNESPEEPKSTEKSEIAVGSRDEELSIKQEPNESPERDNLDDTQFQSMSNLNSEHANSSQLYSYDESCTIIEEILNSSLPDPKEDGTDEFIEVVSNRQLSHAPCLDSKPKSKDQLLADEQELSQLPHLRWHNPNGNDQDIKMGIMEELEHISLPVNVSFNERTGADAAQQKQQQLNEHIGDVSLEQPMPEIIEQLEVRHTEEAEAQQQGEESVTEQQLQELEQSQQQYLPAESMQSIPNAHYLPAERLTASSYTQHMMQRIILPPLYPGDQLQSTSASNNNLLSNDNIQQHFMNPPEYVQHWNFDKYSYSQPTAQQQLSHDWQQQQQAEAQAQAHVQAQAQAEALRQQQHQTFLQDQHLEACQKELHQLNAQYHKLKSHEDEEFKSLNKALKEVYADRLICERQHADLHRKFMNKMIESKKQEESIHAHKNELKRQLDTEANNLEQLIANKHRQLHECTRSLQLQRQQYESQQQHQQHQQQQHFAFSQQQHPQFLQRLPPPAYQPRLQCFQDAFAHSLQMRMSPSSQMEAQRRLIRVAPPVAYMQPPMTTSSSDCQSHNDSVMPHRHTAVDYRSIDPYPQRSTTNAPVNRRRANCISIVPATATSNIISTAHHFTRPETPASDGRSQVNQTIEQTGIVSIIDSYVSNYLNDMESNNS